MDNIQKQHPRRMNKFIAGAGVLVMALFVFFLGIGVGASSQTHQPAQPVTANTAASTDTAQPKETQCPMMGDINYSGMCQPVVKGMSCTFLQGSSSYTCSLSLYNSSKFFNCTLIGTTATCF